MQIALFCATQRGIRFLQKLHDLAPDAELLVFSFREDTWEPPFVDDIRQLAESFGAQFYEAKQVGVARWEPLWDSTDVDLMLAVSWRYMIPAQVYKKARLGAYVLHDSLLPKYRGFSPTVWAMINGEDHSGVTLLEMVEDYDAGDIIGQERVAINPDDTIADLLERVTETYLQVLEHYLPDLMAGTAKAVPQDHAQATYTAKLLPDDFEIDWGWSTERIYNLIRATTYPYAGAYTILEGQKLRVWGAKLLDHPRRYVGRIPGRVIEVRADEGTVVLTGDGLLLLTEIQLEGGERLPAAQVLNRFSYTVGR